MIGIQRLFGRGFGDSTDVEASETTMVEDSTVALRFLQARFSQVLASQLRSFVPQSLWRLRKPAMSIFLDARILDRF